MVAIKCDKCGFESDNEYQFGQRHFRFIPDSISCPSMHLCVACQSDLRLAINKTVAEFMGAPGIRNWAEGKGIMS